MGVHGNLRVFLILGFFIAVTGCQKDGPLTQQDLEAGCTNYCKLMDVCYSSGTGSEEYISYCSGMCLGRETGFGHLSDGFLGCASRLRADDCDGLLQCLIDHPPEIDDDRDTSDMGYDPDVDDPPECEIVCKSNGEVGLTCGTNRMNCTNSYDSHGRVSYVRCTYSNGRSFSCDISYNSLGQARGHCTGEGDSCYF